MSISCLVSPPAPRRAPNLCSIPRTAAAIPHHCQKDSMRSRPSGRAGRPGRREAHESIARRRATRATTRSHITVQLRCGGHPKSGETGPTPVTEQTYRCLATEDPERKWELHDGELREKPDMSAEHNDAMSTSVMLLQQQLDRSQFRLRVNAGRVRRTEKTWYIPDVTVIPTELELAQRGEAGIDSRSTPTRCRSSSKSGRHRPATMT